MNLLVILQRMYMIKMNSLNGNRMLFLCGLRGAYMKLINENDMIFYGDLSCNRTNSENAWKIRVLQRITNVLVLDRGNFQEV